jgi:hypothetical protein
MCCLICLVAEAGWLLYWFWQNAALAVLEHWVIALFPDAEEPAVRSCNLPHNAVLPSFVIKKTPWSEPASEIFLPSDRCLSAKWLPTFVDRGCHVVSMTDPYGRILGFLASFVVAIHNVRAHSEMWLFMGWMPRVWITPCWTGCGESLECRTWLHFPPVQLP